jgi:hypothetical protein
VIRRVGRLQFRIPELRKEDCFVKIENKPVTVFTGGKYPKETLVSAPPDWL